MNSRDVRQLFTRFFEERGHRRIPSSSLIPPPEEKTLLFTNAGMNQMKPFFMGLARPPATRLTSIQKCFRTSDIEEVGDASHCTFFEMLGNFSVGDYFKAEVIPWAWELLTMPQPDGLGLDKDHIWATVFLDDDEAYDLWRSVGIPPERIVRYDESENYWFMIKGGVGPCGPNTEIYYDYGAGQGCGQPGCSPPLHTPPSCNRFMELWNLVFMTLFQDEDGSRRPLPFRNVDTGGGLERWPGPVLWQNKVDWQDNPKEWSEPPTIFDGDLFQPILARVGELAGLEYENRSPTNSAVTIMSRWAQNRAMRIIAEHTRAATFLIADGVFPSNEDRGYVLRRLIRRAIYYSRTVPTDIAAVAQAVIELMDKEYPQLREHESSIVRVLSAEEDQARTTIGRGSIELEATLSALTGAGKNVVPGERVFYLHDTYGFHLELTREIATSRGFTLDEDGFTRLMQEQRQRSRRAQTVSPEGIKSGEAFGSTRVLQTDAIQAQRLQTYAELDLDHTEFLGYETTRVFASVAAILLDGVASVRTLTSFQAGGHRVEVVLDRTPFYAEGGGQVADQGVIVWPEGRFVVEDTQAVGEGGVIAHIGRLESGILTVGDPVEARVDEDRRADTMRNHTATHILHASLRKLLGSHVRQAGSLVAPDRLRFDFTHLEALTPEQVREVEALANRVVRDNLIVHIEHKSYEEALAEGALAFFGDKYADVVRVVGVCDLDLKDCFSHELCGGTHVHASGDVGAILITAETSIGAGLRRLEAVTGRAAAERMRDGEETLARLSATLQAPSTELESRLAGLREENDRLRKQLQTMERRLARNAVDEVEATVIGDTSIVARQVDAASADALREAGDALKSRFKSAVILLAAVIDGKPAFLAMATPDVAKRVPAGDVIKAAASVAGGGGGGRPELAQGGGTDVTKIEAALAAGKKLIEEKLQA